MGSLSPRLSDYGISVRLVHLAIVIAKVIVWSAATAMVITHFSRNPFGEKEIPKIPTEECFKHPKVLWGMKERFPTVKDFP